MSVLLQKDIVSIPHVMFFWNHIVNYIDWRKVWMVAHKYLITNKVKEISFRIIHKSYPAHHDMVKFKSLTVFPETLYYR